MKNRPVYGLPKPTDGAYTTGMLNQPIYDFVLEHLGASRGRWPAVAIGSGVSRRTIEKIARKEIADPGVSHIQKLADYFSNKQPK